MSPNARLGRYTNGRWYVFVCGKGDIAITTDGPSAIAAMRLLCGQKAVEECRAYMRELVTALNAEGRPNVPPPRRRKVAK
jgi:hypothetical protein